MINVLKKITTGAKNAPRLLYQKDAGFTIIETVIVILILGIIATISLPVYRQVSPTIILNSETRDLVSDLRYAQQLAVTEQANHSILFDDVLGTYIITNDETLQVVRNVTINPKISIDSIIGFTSSTAIFNVTGASLESGSITLMNINSVTSTISIKPSGYVKIEQ